MMNEADCLLVLGSSFSNHTGITPKKPTIQVDYDAMTLGKFHPVDVPVWGEIAATAGILKNGLSNVNNVDQRPDVATHWEIWRAEKQSRMKDDFGNGINSSLIFDSMNRKIPANAIITVDVGNNTYSFGRYFECTHQSVLMSGYLGSIGFSLPAAMGAWAATQEDDPKFKGRPVVSISGDGGFGQYLAEVTTAVKYGMDITHVLLHNKQLGKISKEQKAGEWDVWQTSLHNPDFSKFVDNCGGLGLRVTEPSKLDEALGAALNHKGFSLVEIMSDPELI
jgi:thiamine pyrophosphate-dependent acetolactate synthase large subunit-like protein